jgi:methionyl-tRNA formyltransferase
MDAGAVLGMSRLAIGELETAGELHDRLSLDGAPLMLQVIDHLAAGTAREEQQDESQATKAIKLSRESSRIDWTRPADVVARQIRGMYPWPGCRVRLLDPTGVEIDRLSLVRARKAHGGGSKGGFITNTGTVLAGDAAIEVVEVQPEGKRPMPLAAYRNGHRWEAGLRVESIA